MRCEGCIRGGFHLCDYRMNLDTKSKCQKCEYYLAVESGGFHIAICNHREERKVTMDGTTVKACNKFTPQPARAGASRTGPAKRQSKESK